MMKLRAPKKALDFLDQLSAYQLCRGDFAAFSNYEQQFFFLRF
jgi:hypothetical protein